MLYFKLRHFLKPSSISKNTYEPFAVTNLNFQNASIFMFPPTSFIEKQNSFVYLFIPGQCDV